MRTSKGIEDGGMKHLSDQQLMQIVQSGDFSPASEIYDRYSARVYSFAYQFVRNAESAEDLTQDVFVKVLKRSNQYNGEGKFSTWLFSITANTCRDWLRRSENKTAKESEEVLVELPGLPEDNPDRRMEQRQDQDRVNKALGVLTADQREAILLSKYQGLSYGEIAQVVGCSEGAVKTRVFRAMEILKRVLLGEGEVSGVEGKASGGDRWLNVAK
jgi:RNA polymerase sigma factor (sigma-70 family)